jgi:hypothetical protein
MHHRPYHALVAALVSGGCADVAPPASEAGGAPSTSLLAAAVDVAAAVAEASGGLDGSGVSIPDLRESIGPQRLLPAVENSMRFAARVEVTHESSLRVQRGSSAMTSLANESISSSLVIHVIDGSKWGVETFEVSFDSLSVAGDGHGAVSLGPSGPRAGETWTCRAQSNAFNCIDNATAAERTLPDWVPVTVVGLMPGAPVEVGESWTRASVDALFSVPGRADVDAALMLRGRVIGDNALDIAFQLEGTAEDTAYGRTVPLRITGGGHIRFVPEVEEVTEFAWSWTGDGTATIPLDGVEARCDRTRRMTVEAALLRL